MTVGRGFGRRWRGLTAAVSAWSLVSVIGVGWTPPPAVAAGTAAASGPVAPTPIGAGAVRPAGRSACQWKSDPCSFLVLVG